MSSSASQGTAQGAVFRILLLFGGAVSLLRKSCVPPSGIFFKFGNLGPSRLPDMDAVCYQVGLGFGYSVDHDRFPSTCLSNHDKPIPIFQSLWIKFPWIEKCELIVSCPSFLRFRWSIHRMLLDGKLLRNNHDTFAVL